jgi:hypothetical protein
LKVTKRSEHPSFAAAASRSHGNRKPAMSVETELCGPAGSSEYGLSNHHARMRFL